LTIGIGGDFMNIDLKSKSMTVETTSIMPSNEPTEISVGLDSFAMALSLQQHARHQNNATVTKALAPTALLPHQSNATTGAQRTTTSAAHAESAHIKPRMAPADAVNHTVTAEQEVNLRQRQARIAKDRHVKERQEAAQGNAIAQQQRQLKQRQQQRLEQQRGEQQRVEQQRSQDQRQQTSNATTAARANSVNVAATPSSPSTMASRMHSETNSLHAPEKLHPQAPRPTPELHDRHSGFEQTTMRLHEYADDTRYHDDTSDDTKIDETHDAEHAAQDALLQLITSALHFDAKTSEREAYAVEQTTAQATVHTVDETNLTTNIAAQSLDAAPFHNSPVVAHEANHAWATIGVADKDTEQRLGADDVISKLSLGGQNTGEGPSQAVTSAAKTPADHLTTASALTSFNAAPSAERGQRFDALSFVQGDRSATGDGMSLHPLMGGPTNNECGNNAALLPTASLVRQPHQTTDGLNIQSIQLHTNKDNATVPPMLEPRQGVEPDISAFAQENAALEASTSSTATTKPVPTSGAPALSTSMVGISPPSSAQMQLAQQLDAAKLAKQEQYAGTLAAADLNKSAATMSARLAQAKLQEQLQDKALDKIQDKAKDKLQQKAQDSSFASTDSTRFGSGGARSSKDIVMTEQALVGTLTNAMSTASSMAAQSSAFMTAQSTGGTAPTAMALAVANSNTSTASAQQSTLSTPPEASTHLAAEPVGLLQPDAAVQLADRISAQLQSKLQTVDVKLAPEQLGEMTIRIELQQDQLSVSLWYSKVKPKNCSSSIYLSSKITLNSRECNWRIRKSNNSSNNSRNNKATLGNVNSMR
jgi:hypothetical protein